MVQPLVVGILIVSILSLLFYHYRHFLFYSMSFVIFVLSHWFIGQTQSKAEWLLGYTHAQMSYHKALEVLGVSEAVVEEDRARRLGELGVWGGTMHDNFIREGDDVCGGFFTKRRRSASQDSTSLGITLPGTVVFPPTTVRQETTGAGITWSYVYCLGFEADDQYKNA